MLDPEQELLKIQQDIRFKNKRYKKAILSVLRACDLENLQIDKQKLIEHLTPLTLEEYTEASQHQEILEVGMSNSVARLRKNTADTTQAPFTDSDAIIRQLLWQKFRAFSIDFVAETNNRTSSFLYLIGYMRMTFENHMRPYPDTCIPFSIDAVLSEDCRHDPFGQIYKYAGYSRSVLGPPAKDEDGEMLMRPDNGSSSEQVNSEPGGAWVWNKNFNSLNELLKKTVEKNPSDGYTMKLENSKGTIFTVISDDDMSKKKELIDILKTLHSMKSSDKILVCKDQFDGYVVSMISAGEGENIGRSICKYYVRTNPNPDNCNGIMSGNFIALSLGNVTEILLSKKEDGTPSTIIICEHSKLAPLDFTPILNHALDKLFAVPKDPKRNSDFIALLGEFCFLFINIMPYIRGSAAIGEWLMYGLAKSHGVDLGAMNSSCLGWDFSAFCATSPKQYGENFAGFFTPSAQLNNSVDNSQFKHKLQELLSINGGCDEQSLSTAAASSPPGHKPA
jgi:hypothetical protein